MSIKESYNFWASQYDNDVNKTRDLEAICLKKNLGEFSFKNVLEIGCGTGKNTKWLATKAEKIIAADLSEEMLRIAKEKIKQQHVQFIQFDMLTQWKFTEAYFDLITFSLVLEHIEHIDKIIQKAFTYLHPGGRLYIGELHPFKQYTGSQAKFEINSNIHLVECYTHHLSNFMEPALHCGLTLEKCMELFDEDTNQPRILSFCFRKN